ncbi:beta-N-acetylhexosaminidase [Oerskovia flava]|uniref:beta-N-acetylhexosaminidase n=1 Tax=Oerskovia flava TaxID=2986422 RepID=UPI00224003BA|nr:beta-N-acetylhexosaminidase [Oerskovia sp. JB1-3-2]
MHTAAGLLPAPVSVVAIGTPGASGASAAPGTVPGMLTLRTGVRVSAHPELAAAARWWRRTTESAFGIDLHGVPEAPADVTFAVGPDLPAGGYRLTVDGDGVRVEAADAAGAHAAAQTLRQLAGPQAYRAAPTAPDITGVNLAHVTITDHPRFVWRGVLLDVARHFMPPREVMRFVDLAAAHKLNVVQLHLTDDQGWRMPVERYPRLTTTGGWRRESNVGTWRSGVLDGRPHGGSYTRDDLREIVAHARERGVTIVPEIDVPGHVEAAVAAYPELGTRKTPHEVRTTWGVSTEVLDPSEDSLAFFRHVLDEVLDVFDSPWIALGGDEVPATLWREQPEIVARAQDLGLADVTGLHGWFLARLAEHVRAAGRRAIVWDEAFGPQLPTDVAVTSWRGYAVGARALAAGHDVVMSPEQVVYLDHRAGDGADEPVPVGFLRTVEDVYAFEPMPAGALAETLGTGTTTGRLLGAQAAVWTEHLDSPRRVDYATYPRLAAFAEAVWSPATDRSPGSPTSREFLGRLERDHLPRLSAAGVEHRPLDGPHPWQTRPGAQGFPRDLAAETAAGGWAGVGGWVDGRDDGAQP